MKKWWILGGSIIGCLVAAPVVFGVVVVLLNMIGKAFGMSYEMTNIVIYYILIPLIWLVMLVIFAYRAKKVLYWILVWIIGLCNFYDIYDFINTYYLFKEKYSNSLFNYSVDFLDKLPGSYVLASVYICVVIPIVITCGLYYMIKNKIFVENYKRTTCIFIMFVFFAILELSSIFMFANFHFDDLITNFML